MDKKVPESKEPHKMPGKLLAGGNSCNFVESEGILESVLMGSARKNFDYYGQAYQHLVAHKGG
eukprot:4864026-Amphidinium_carterae.1